MGEIYSCPSCGTVLPLRSENGIIRPRLHSDERLTAEITRHICPRLSLLEKLFTTPSNPGFRQYSNIKVEKQFLGRRPNRKCTVVTDVSPKAESKTPNSDRKK